MKQRSIGKAAFHMVKHRHIFYFRISIPQDIKSTLAQSEIRLSLKTPYLTEARAKANELSVIAEKLFRKIRKGNTGIMADLTNKNFCVVLNF